MSTRKSKRQPNHNHPSDYDSDAPDQSNAPPIRSNEELNLSVLKRHNPSITSILSLAAYAVVYIFSPASKSWEKSGVEGTLFVCQLGQGSLGEERYSIFVLNRRGLDNFDVPLTDGENVELTEEYVILKSDSNPELDTGGIMGTNAAGAAAQNGARNNPKDVKIYGLWIYSEPPPKSTAEARTINARVIRECAVHAGRSLKLARERQEASRQNGMHIAAAATTTAAPPVEPGVPMGRQISLKDLFGQQRVQDAEWSVNAHNLGPGEAQQPPMPAPPPKPDVLGDLFRKAGLAYQSGQR